MAQPTETSVPSGTANVDRSGFSAPSFNLLPASSVSAPEWDCICRECSKVMNDECCGMCDRREGREFYEICNDCCDKVTCAQCGVETDYMYCANDCGAWECRKCADGETHMCGTCKEKK